MKHYPKGLDGRERLKDGRIHEKRGDTLVKNLKLEYPEFADINGHTELGTLKKQFGVESLDAVRRALRKK
jgi:hypothetical protein